MNVTDELINSKSSITYPVYIFFLYVSVCFSSRFCFPVGALDYDILCRAISNKVPDSIVEMILKKIPDG